MFAREKIGALRVVFPRGMDANEYARKMKPATEALGLLLRAAEWMHGPKERPAIGAALPPALTESDEVCRRRRLSRRSKRRRKMSETAARCQGLLLQLSF